MDLSKFSLLQWYLLILIVAVILVASRYTHRKVVVAGTVLFTEQAFLFSIAILILTILASLRTGLGDTSNYINTFHRLPTEWSSFIDILSEYNEKGFYLLNFIIKRVFGDNQNIYLFITSFVTIAGVAYFSYKNSSNPGICMLIYILSGSYVSGMNGVRQALVTGIFVVFYKFIERRNYIQYIILCLLLSTIHTSALVLIPMIFIFNIKEWGRGTYVLLSATFGLYIAYPLFAGVLTQALAGSAYEVYSNGIQNFTNGGANVLRAIILFIPITLSFIFKEKLKKKNPNFKIILNASILNFMFMLLATVRSWIFARFCVYFNPFSYVLLVECIEVSGKKNRQILYIACILLYGLFFYYEMRTSVYAF